MAMVILGFGLYHISLFKVIYLLFNYIVACVNMASRKVICQINHDSEKVLLIRPYCILVYYSFFAQYIKLADGGQKIYILIKYLYYFYFKIYSLLGSVMFLNLIPKNLRKLKNHNSLI